MTKEKAIKWMDNQIEFREKILEPLKDSRFYVSQIDIRKDREIHITNVTGLANVINYPYIWSIWKEGNEQCNTNYVEVYINYKGYRWFELIDKEKWNKQRSK